MRALAPAVVVLELTACGGDGSDSVLTPPTVGYNIGGYVSGLKGTGLTLTDDSGVSVSLSRNGAFTIETNVVSGTSYAVAISTQPTNPTQTCTIGQGTGAVDNADISSIRIICPQPAGRFAYVVKQGIEVPSVQTFGQISAYMIDTSTGTLTLVSGSTVPTGPVIASFQPVPHASFAWALNIGNLQSDTTGYTVSSIFNYGLDPSTGRLTPAAGNPSYALNATDTTGICSVGNSGIGSTQSLTLASSGLYGYASDGGLWTFTIDPVTGEPKGLGSRVPGVCAMGPVAIDPSGQFAYVSKDGINAGIYAFTIDSTSGALTLVKGSPFGPAGGQLTIDPAGRFVYANDSLLPVIHAFTIDPFSGALNAVSSISVPSTPQQGRTIPPVIEPGGRFAYVCGIESGLYAYSIDPVTGALTLIGRQADIQLPYAPLIDPSGQFLYVSATASAIVNVQQGIYAYAINANSGALVLVPGSPFVVGPDSREVMAVTN